MTTRLRTPVLALATLSICLNLAIIGTAGRTLSIFHNQKTDNAYFLPVWPQHFDTRELSALIGTSTAIVVLNAVLIAALFVSSSAFTFVPLIATILSAAVSLIAIIFPAVLNNHTSAARDTLQSWTCRWHGIHEQGVPAQFGSMCHESRFAFYTTIPSFVIQLVLVAAALIAVSSSGAAPSRFRLDEEKGQELDDRVRTPGDYDAKTGSVHSVQDMERILGKH